MYSTIRSVPFNINNNIRNQAKRILKKYGVTNVARNILKTRKIQRKLKKRRNIIKTKKTKNVQNFFLRDSVSRATSGKKETITKHKKKMQKRYLSDTLENLHLQYNAEFPQMSVSYTEFTMLRPFWVLFEKVENRETCACLRCDNLKLLITSMKNNGLVNIINPHYYVRQLVCANFTENCMLRHCKDCQNNQVNLPLKYKNTATNYDEWQSDSKEHVNKEGDIKTLKQYKKITVSCLTSGLTEKFKQQLVETLLPHVYRIKNQFEAITNSLQKIDDKTAIL